MDKARELAAEFRQVFSGRGGRWFDALLPILIFLITRAWAGTSAALLAALGGPSVAEFQEQKPPPWQGQRRGF